MSRLALPDERPDGLDAPLTKKVMKLASRAHVRLFKRGARATLDAHRPANHRAIIDTTIERLLARAAAIGPAVAQVCVFRLMPATDSAAWRPPIPRHAGRVFRGMAATP